MSGLWLRVETLSGRTHRGEYRVHVILDGSEYDGRAWATFHDHAGYSEHVEAVILSGLDSIGRVVAACHAHARAQPAHPSMPGWPACEELP